MTSPGKDEALDKLSSYTRDALVGYTIPDNICQHFDDFNVQESIIEYFNG